jgi:hypothetical protein
MAQQLTVEYLNDHMEADAAAGMRNTPQEFADALIDVVLQMGKDQVESSTTQDEVEISVPVRLRAVEKAGVAPQSGCIEVCVGPILWQVCYHRDFKGDRPGPG